MARKRRRSGFGSFLDRYSKNQKLVGGIVLAAVAYLLLRPKPAAAASAGAQTDASLEAQRQQALIKLHR